MHLYRISPASPRRRPRRPVPPPAPVLALALAAAWIAPAGPAAAAPLPPRAALLVCDASLDRVMRLEDRDGSGMIDPAVPGEVTVFYDDASPGPDLSTPSAMAAGKAGEAYLLDGGTVDAVIVLRDLDGDGDASGDGEFAIFYDASSPGPNLSTPNALAVLPDGTILIADDGRGQGLVLAIRDLDGDGSALGAGEWRVFYSSVEAAAAGAAVVIADPEALAADAAGERIYVADATLKAVFLLEDLNGDGDALDDGEAALFYDPQGAHPFADPEALSVGAGGEVYATDEDTGLIARLEDRDRDRRISGAEEARIFIDATAAASPRDTNDLLAIAGGALLVLDGSRDQVWRLEDLDGDGAAFSAGEAVPLLPAASGVLGTPAGLALIAVPEERVVLARVEPASGGLAGGNRAALAGRFPGFEDARVLFGAAPAAILSASIDRIECSVPPGSAPGAVDVEVSTPRGRAVLAAGYRYLTPSAGFRRGEANGDGLIDISDAVAILGYLFLGSPPPVCLDAADVDDSGAVDISDPIYLLDHLFLGGKPPPAPFPGEGQDPTADLLDC